MLSRGLDIASRRVATEEEEVEEDLEEFDAEQLAEEQEQGESEAEEEDPCYLDQSNQTTFGGIKGLQTFILCVCHFSQAWKTQSLQKVPSFLKPRLPWREKSWRRLW